MKMCVWCVVLCVQNFSSPPFGTYSILGHALRWGNRLGGGLVIINKTTSKRIPGSPGGEGRDCMEPL